MRAIRSAADRLDGSLIPGSRGATVRIAGYLHHGLSLRQPDRLVSYGNFGLGPYLTKRIHAEPQRGSDLDHAMA